MNQESPSSIGLEELRRQLDAALEDGALDQDVRAAALTALEFCELLSDQLDEDQRNACHAAQQFWMEGSTDARIHWLSIYSKRLDAAGKLSDLDRLIWCSLNSNTGMSDHMAEFLVLLGRDVGLEPAEMKSVFSKHIPNLDGY
ncbi:hypothetical protein [Stenotrophomonas oahuensis]|uniref:Uncharacterized protein n=1 Tax=Stenotrophomonas oahuensis TaxID=3003271 RepID=A0ABY9YNF8_9GAMM|nr:hypothetical protein [Stenotrophomonas sp. A5586]WNH52267.1 hypothetical protein PDM29_18330 [Stenotrophomonas sp. A5586]